MLLTVIINGLLSDTQIYMLGTVGLQLQAKGIAGGPTVEKPGNRF